MIALGQTAGAVMSQAGKRTAQYARTRIQANAPAHGLAGSREYDDEVIGRAVFSTEAGISFLHTHAEGIGPVVLLAATLVAGKVGPPRGHGLASFRLRQDVDHSVVWRRYLGPRIDQPCGT